MADQDYETLRSEVQQLRTDIGNITETLKGLASSQGEQAYERLRAGVGSARQRATQAGHAVEHQVEEHPLASLLVVFVGGLLTGLLLRSRR
jgi:ElaB/YqjD/DUF883 family membrane-anchored ribosome-binding protein